MKKMGNYIILAAQVFLFLLTFVLLVTLLIATSQLFLSAQVSI